MMASLKLAFVMVAIAVIAATIIVITPQDSPDSQMMRAMIHLDAVYHPDTGNVTISYADDTGADVIVSLEMLGLPESYRKEFAGPKFEAVVWFEAEPKYGWAIHPVVAYVEHPEFGSLQIKTEVYQAGMAVPRTIYGTR